MEEHSIQLTSIWGKWWEPIRKWFYPAWLLYETTIRFYAYALYTYDYIMDLQFGFNDIIIKLLAICCGSISFLICFFFLTIPASISLFKFFKTEKSSSPSFGRKLKTYF